MQRTEETRAEAAHHIYEQQVAAVDARMRDELWDKIASAAGAPGTGEDALRVAHDARDLILTDPPTGRTLRFVADEVLDLPEGERPGPFQMGNARVTLTAWDGTQRAWLLRHVAGEVQEYAWVTLPGDVPVDDGMLRDLVVGLRRGQMPADPSETAHLDTTAPENNVTSLATSIQWAIVNLYSGQVHRPDEVFAGGAEAGAALKELVRSGELQEGDWEVRPMDR